MTTVKKKTDSILYFSSVTLLAFSVWRIWDARFATHTPGPPIPTPGVQIPALSSPPVIAENVSASAAFPPRSVVPPPSFNGLRGPNQDGIDYEHAIIDGRFNPPALMWLDVNQVKERLKSLPAPVEGTGLTHSNKPCSTLRYTLDRQTLTVQYNPQTLAVLGLNVRGSIAPRPR